MKNIVKKLLCAMAVSFLSSAFLWQSAVTAQQLEPSKTFVKGDFSVSIPKGWSQREWMDGGGFFVLARAPWAREDTAPSELRIVSSKPKNPAALLEECYKNFSQSLAAVKSKTSYKVGTLTGYRAEFQKDVGPEKTRVLMLFLRDASRVYTLEFSVDNRDYPKTLPLIEKVIQSFKGTSAK